MDVEQREPFDRTGYELTVEPVDANLATATIYDADVLIYATSVLNEARGMDEFHSARVSFEPHELLETLGRGRNGRRVGELKNALARLRNTRVHLIDSGKDRDRPAWPEFHSTLLAGYECPDRRTGSGVDKPLWHMTVAEWVHERVMADGEAIKLIPSWYFGLRKDPLARVVARLAIVKYNYEKSSKRARIPFRHIRDRSGSCMEPSAFASSMKRIIEWNGLPDYNLSETRDKWHNRLLVIEPRDPGAASGKPSSKEPGPSSGGTGGSAPPGQEPIHLIVSESPDVSDGKSLTDEITL